ncbi:hypothetical protein FIBSPDRAFT_141565 [Athelia psychrophila]|uniref:Uncharacterized protein n=1 Tax=Athelia psychrophila TaxID=1759441 RepID=A0A166SZN6_9AGAM|nr:hypothetical protein FIBSPDRAFT_141565 [Fibularhizoctonia sp. CBS 109695]
MLPYDTVGLFHHSDRHPSAAHSHSKYTLHVIVFPGICLPLCGKDVTHVAVTDHFSGSLEDIKLLRELIIGTVSLHVHYSDKIAIMRSPAALCARRSPTTCAGTCCRESLP